MRGYIKPGLQGRCNSLTNTHKSKLYVSYHLPSSKTELTRLLAQTNKPTTSTMTYNWNKTVRGIKSTLQTERGMVSSLKLFNDE